MGPAGAEKGAPRAPRRLPSCPSARRARSTLCVAFWVELLVVRGARGCPLFRRRVGGASCLRPAFSRGSPSYGVSRPAGGSLHRAEDAELRWGPPAPKKGAPPCSGSILACPRSVESEGVPPRAPLVSWSVGSRSLSFEERGGIPFFGGGGRSLMSEAGVLARLPVVTPSHARREAALHRAERRRVEVGPAGAEKGATPGLRAVFLLSVREACPPSVESEGVPPSRSPLAGSRSVGSWCRRERGRSPLALPPIVVGVWVEVLRSRAAPRRTASHPRREARLHRAERRRVGARRRRKRGPPPGSGPSSFCPSARRAHGVSRRTYWATGAIVGPVVPSKLPSGTTDRFAYSAAGCRLASSSP